MKKIILPALLAGVTLFSCSKNNTTNNSTGSNNASTLPAPYYFKCTINGTAVDYGHSAIASAQIDKIYQYGSAYTGLTLSFRGTAVNDTTRLLNIQIHGAIKDGTAAGGYPDLVRKYSAYGDTAAVMTAVNGTITGSTTLSNFFFASNGSYYQTHVKTNALQLTITAIDDKSVTGVFTGILAVDSTKSSFSAETITNGSFYMPHQ